MESFRRDLLNDVAEHRSTVSLNEELKYLLPRFNYTPKTGIALFKTNVLFLLCMLIKIN